MLDIRLLDGDTNQAPNDRVAVQVTGLEELSNTDSLNFSDHEMKILEAFLGDNTHQDNGEMNAEVTEQHDEADLAITPKVLVRKALFGEQEVVDQSLTRGLASVRQTRSEHESDFGMVMEESHGSVPILMESQIGEINGEVSVLVKQTDHNTPAYYTEEIVASMDVETVNHQTSVEEEIGEILNNQMIVDSVDETRMEEDMGKKEKQGQHGVQGRKKGNKGNVILKGAGSKKRMVQALVSPRKQMM